MVATPRPSAETPAEEYRQLHRRLIEQVVDRATADPEWRKRYLDDPQEVVGAFVEAQKLQHIHDEQQRLIRNLNEQVLDKAESDPVWKQQLLLDPQAAMRELSKEETEVVGQGSLLTLTDHWGSNYYDVWHPSDPTHPGDPYIPGDPTNPGDPH